MNVFIKQVSISVGIATVFSAGLGVSMKYSNTYYKRKMAELSGK
jgi:hypothetical protein